MEDPGDEKYDILVDRSAVVEIGIETGDGEESTWGMVVLLVVLGYTCTEGAEYNNYDEKYLL